MKQKRTYTSAKGVRISKVRIADKSKGGMKNHVTMSGASFMAILEGVSPQRLVEALGVYIKKLSPKSRRAFLQTIADEAGLKLGDTTPLSKDDAKLLAMVKKLKLRIQ